MVLRLLYKSSWLHSQPLTVLMNGIFPTHSSPFLRSKSAAVVSAAAVSAAADMHDMLDVLQPISCGHYFTQLPPDRRTYEGAGSIDAEYWAPFDLPRLR